MCKKLLAGGVPGLHFYTLNLEKSVVHILEGLNFVASYKQLGVRPTLPWEKHIEEPSAETSAHAFTVSCWHVSRQESRACLVT